MSKPVAYRFKSPATEEWLLGLEPPVGSRWEVEGLYSIDVPNQDWDLLAETQAALRDAWAILKKLKAVQDAARELVESDPDSAADTEGEAFAAWCALVAAIDDADTLLIEFGESRDSTM
jgi:hypothetical protein